MKLGSIFSGGGGYDIGAKQAGFTPTWAIEYIPYIAACYAKNLGDHVIVGDLLDILPQSLEYVDLFHASPPCPNFSNAKTDARETALDRCFAHWISHYIRVKRPLFFTLENVTAYRKSESWQIIQRALVDEGYGFDWWILNSADYGTPQTRKRMIVVGRRDGRKPQRPAPTHEKTPRGFLALPQWIGWYEAIEDLLEGLPTAYHKKGQSCEYDPLGLECRNSEYCRGHFAKWQERRLPDEIKDSLMVTNQEQGSSTTRGSGVPSYVVTSGSPQRHALLFDASNPNSNGREKFKRADAPSRTVVSGDGVPRALLVRPDNTSQKKRTTDKADPIFTVTVYSPKHPAPLAYTGYRIVKLTPRCLARFQGFPDDYELPVVATHAARIIGNAVAVPVAYAVCKSLLE